MNLVSGDTIWTKVNKINYKYIYLSDDMECDVAIIGAGVTGAICAYYFTQAGIKTVVFDRNIIGFESTSASTSILQYEVDYMLSVLREMIGFEKALKAFKLCEKAVYDIQEIINGLDDKSEFTRRESLFYSSRPAEYKSIKKEYELRKENGFDVEFLDRKTAQEKFSFPIEAGILSRSGAAEIDPYRFSHALISESVKKGLEVYEHTEISEIKPKEDYVILTTKFKNSVKARRAIITTGFEAKNLIAEKIVSLSRTFCVATKPVHSSEGWHNRCIIRDSNQTYSYIRSTNDNRIIIGGEDSSIGGINSKMSNLDNGDPAAKEKFIILVDRLKTMFPGIQGIEAEYEFSGIFGSTKDGLPYLGEYGGMPCCYFCLGYGSNGILYNIFGAQFLRDLYMGNHRPELDIFRFGR